jgi:hypothetical protein
MKMGVGGVSADIRRLYALATFLDEDLQHNADNAPEGLVEQVRRMRRQLELQTWRTAPMFRRPR